MLFRSALVGATHLLGLHHFETIPITEVAVAVMLGRLNHVTFSPPFQTIKYAVCVLKKQRAVLNARDIASHAVAGPINPSLPGLVRFAMTLTTVGEGVGISGTLTAFHLLCHPFAAEIFLAIACISTWYSTVPKVLKI